MSQAKKDGKDGIDRWTSNGYGITVKKNENKELNEEIRKISKNDDFSVIVRNNKKE